MTSYPYNTEITCPSPGIIIVVFIFFTFWGGLSVCLFFNGSHQVMSRSIQDEHRWTAWRTDNLVPRSLCRKELRAALAA